MLQVSNISKSYGKNEILKDLSFELGRSEVIAILGASGSGKSTLLKLINRLVPFHAGEIVFEGSNVLDCDLRTLRKSISYMFQKGVIFPHLTVFENIALPLEADYDKPEISARVSTLMKMMDLGFEFKSRYPHELSGGQAQRVSLAQSLAIDPDLILLDEPFNGLDTKTKKSLMQKMLEIKKTFGKSMILVTHDVFEAEFMADRIFELEGGRLIECGDFVH